MSLFPHLISLILLVVLSSILHTQMDTNSMSDQLLHWRNSGQYFLYQNYQIFFDVHEGHCLQNNSLLLLHGFPSSSYDFVHILDGLKEKFCRVIYLDFLGFGFSDKPADRVTYLEMKEGFGLSYSMKEQADIVEGLLEYLGVERVDILSHDYGVSVAQEMLARFEEGASSVDISSIAFLNGGLYPELHKALFIQRVLVGEYGKYLSVFVNKFLFRRNVQKVFGPDTQPSNEFLDDTWNLNKYHNGHILTHLLIQYIQDRKDNSNRWIKNMNSTKLPLHVINGPFDPVSGEHLYEKFISISQELKRETMTAVKLPSMIGHWPQVEAPDLVLEAYIAFVNENMKAI